MRGLPVVGGGHDLAQGDSAVAGGNAMVPVWRKSRLHQANHGAFEQISIEETAAAEDHARLADAPADLEDRIDQARVKSSRDDVQIDAAAEVGDQLREHWPPVDLSLTA